MFKKIVFYVNARQGCCSHHGGVCGCSCCDGTPLIAKCTPYYDCSDTKSYYSCKNNNRNQTVEHLQSASPDQGLSETVYFNTKQKISLSIVPAGNKMHTKLYFG